MVQTTFNHEPEHDQAVQTTETTRLLPPAIDIEAYSRHTSSPPSWLASVSNELNGIASLAWPVSLATVFRLLVFATDTAFIGQLGTKQLAGAALAQVRSFAHMLASHHVLS
jgi:MATE family multidrug resistance protein